MWIIFSLLAAFCRATINIVDKYVLTKWIKNPLIPVMMIGIIGLAASFIIYFFRGFAPLSNFNVFLSLVAGLLYILTAVFYFKALKEEEASRIVPLSSLSPLFILIFAGIFLGEVFTPLKYLGIILLITGAILISSRSLLKITFSSAFGWMLLAVITASVVAVLTKYILNFTDYWTVFAWTRVGTAIGVAPIIFLYFPELKSITRQYGKKVIIVMSANETLNLFAVLFITIAMSIGYVTLVRALSSVSPLFVLFIAVMLSRFYPLILKEEIGRAVVLQKVLAIVLMLIGTTLIIGLSVS